MKSLITLLTLFVVSTAVAGKEHDHHAVKVSPAFEKMKSLLGTWEGTTKIGGKDMPAKVSYELTSGGTAIVEKLDPGGPFEMVTIYANNGSNVNATHYCGSGNQPYMKLRKSTDNEFSFEMVGTQGISNKNEMHMHAVALTVDGNKLKQEWTNFKDGKKSDTMVFEMTKKM